MRQNMFTSIQGAAMVVQSDGTRHFIPNGYGLEDRIFSATGVCPNNQVLGYQGRVHDAEVIQLVRRDHANDFLAAVNMWNSAAIHLLIEEERCGREAPECWNVRLVELMASVMQPYRIGAIAKTKREWEYHDMLACSFDVGDLAIGSASSIVVQVLLERASSFLTRKVIESASYLTPFLPFATNISAEELAELVDLPENESRDSGDDENDHRSHSRWV